MLSFLVILAIISLIQVIQQLEALPCYPYFYYNESFTKCLWCQLDDSPQDKSTIKNIQHLHQLPNSSNKYVIFSFPRTGSSLLTALLRSHYDIVSLSEIFNTIHKHPSQNYTDKDIDLDRKLFYSKHTRSRDYLKYIWSTNQNRSTIGFKIFGGHLCLQDVVDIFIKESPQVKKIILFRSDLLSEFVSDRIAKEMSSWHSVDTSNMKVKVNYENFLIWRNHVSSFYRILASEITKASQEYFLIEYNRDIRDMTKLNRTLFNLQKHIGVQPIDLLSLYAKNKDSLKKQSHVNVSTQIKNWFDLPFNVRRFADTSLGFNELIML